MSFTNYILEADLLHYAPEIQRLKWSDQSDFSASKTEAERIVIQDLKNKGFMARQVMTPLVFRTAGTALTADATTSVKEDKVERLRFEFTISSWVTGGTKTLKLYGADTNTDSTSWNLVYTSASITADGTTSSVITATYKYYKVTANISGGSMDYTASLVETGFDTLIIYKWLEIIFQNQFTAENDEYFLRMLYFQRLYNDLWNTVKIYTDLNEDGEIDSSESLKTSSITMLK